MIDQLYAVVHATHSLMDYSVSQACHTSKAEQYDSKHADTYVGCSKIFITNFITKIHENFQNSLICFEECTSFHLS